MNYIDVLLILLVLWSIWNGWHRGFIIGIFELISWGGSLFLSFLVYSSVAALLEKYVASLQNWTLPLALLFTFITVRIIIEVIVSRILNSVSQKLQNNRVNRVFGAVPGLINGLIYAALIAVLLLLAQVPKKLSTTVQKSQIASALTGRVGWLETKLSKMVESEGKQAYNLTVAPEAERSIKLPFKIKHPTIQPDLEIEMLKMVNRERTKAGLNPLKPDPELREVARNHSRDMFGRGYFSHITPEGKDPFDRMRKAHVQFLAAGENLALAPNLEQAHSGLMNSSGHRANILHIAYGRVGIGILDGGLYGIMVTQNFRN